MKLHPLHPVLAHAPVTCWTLVPVCDLAGALFVAGDFFTLAAAMMAGIGTGVAVFTATAGAIDYPRAEKTAPKLVLIHASLMSMAFVLSLVGLVGRLGPDWMPRVPCPLWAQIAGALAFLVMLAGAWCGGEMVYGRGIGVKSRDTNP